MKSDNEVYYTSFSQKYKNKEIYSSIDELVFDSKNRFAPIRQVNDLNEMSRYLVYLRKIDLSDNLLTKLVLRNFFNMTILLAPRNQIVDVNLFLPKLTVLDLNTNMISRIINLSLIPNLYELNLSRNMISTITAKDFLPVKISLRKLNLSFNCISFKTVNAFISLVEGLKVFYLDELSLEGNKFIDEFSYFASSYKIFVASTVLSLTKLNGTSLTFTRNANQCDEIKSQMRLEEAASKKAGRITYTSFEEYYDNPEKYKMITSLEMTPSKGFHLKDLTQFENSTEKFLNLVFIDISDNLIKELNFKGLPMLKCLLATRNRISKVELTSLEMIEEIDMSYNLLTSIPDLQKVKGSLSILKMNGNIIQMIELKNLSKFKQSLTKLLLENNRINFDYPITDFIKEILTFTQLSYLNLEDNDFINDTSVYKTYLSSFIAQKGKAQFPFYLDGEDITKIDTPNFLIQKRKKVDHSTVSDENSEDEDKETSKFIGKIEYQLEELNMIFERLINCNGNNSVLYNQLLQQIQDLLSEHSNCGKYNKKLQKISKYENLFDAMLMNAYALLHLNPEFEIPIYRIVAQLSLFEKGELFAQKCFAFYIHLSKGSEEKKKQILEIIEETVVRNLTDADAQKIPFEVLSQILHYLKTTEQLSRILYKNLILSITQLMKSHNTWALLMSDETIVAVDGEYSAKKDMNTFKTCVNFVRAYLKIPSEMKDELLLGKDEEEEDVKKVGEEYKTIGKPEEEEEEQNKETEKQDDNHNHNHNQNEYEYECEDQFRESDSDMSCEDVIDEHPSGTLIEEKYGFKLTDYELMNKLSNDLNRNLTEKRQASIKKLEDFQTEIKKGVRYTIPDDLYGVMLNAEIAKFHKITDLQYISSEEAGKLETVKYAYIFINSFDICYQILIHISDAFKDTTNKENRSRKIQLCKLALKFFIDLANNFLNKKMNSRLRTLLQQCNFAKIIDPMRNFLSSFLCSYVKDTGSLDGLIVDKILNRTMQNPSDSEKGAVNVQKIEFKRIIPVILDCLGCLYSVLKEDKFKQELGNNFLDIVSSVLKISSNNNEYLLFGAINFLRMVIRNDMLKYEPMIFSRVMTRVQNFKALLSYIDYNDKNFKGIFDRIRNSEDQDKRMGRDPLDPYSFQNISNKFLLKVFASVLHIYESLANLELKTFPVSGLAKMTNKDLRESQLYSILGNCLILNNDTIRKLAVECFYYYDHKTITNEVMTQIMSIVSNYSSISIGETEIILSIIYVILNKKLYHLINDGDFVSSSVAMQTAVKMAIGFLFHNTNREADTREELWQKNILSSALILFLNTASRCPSLFSKSICEKDKEEAEMSNFTRILYNDYFFLNDGTYLPIELERTHYGCYLGKLFEPMLVEEGICIPPYSYTFLRILMTIADVLCECTDFSLKCDYSVEYDTLLENLANSEINNRLIMRVTNEKLNWYDFSVNLMQYTNTKDYLQAFQTLRKKQRKHVDEINTSDTYIDDLIAILDSDFEDAKTPTQSGTSYYIRSIGEFIPYREKIIEIEKILKHVVHNISSGNKDENLYKAKPFPKYTLDQLVNEHSNFIVFFPTMLMYLLGQTMNTSHCSIHLDLAAKYDQRIAQSESIIASLQNYIDLSTVQTAFGEIVHFTTEITHTNPISSQMLNKLKKEYRMPPENKTRDERLEPLMSIANPLSFCHIYKRKYISFNFFVGDMRKYEQYGINTNAKRKKEEESVNNPHLRTLIIITFLRCCYAILQSPSKTIRQHFIEFLFIEEKFKQLILFIDTGLLDDYNVAQKGIAFIEKVFHRNTLPNFIMACSFTNFHNKETLESQQKKKLNSKLYKVLDETTKRESSFSLFERNIFHNIYLAAVYLEKIIYYFLNYIFNQKKSDPLFMGDIIAALGNVFYAIAEIRFDKIHSQFIQHFILDLLTKNENVGLIIKRIEYLILQKRNAFRKCQELKLKYMRNKYTNIYCGIGKPSSGVVQEQVKIENYLINYIASNENKITQISELLAGMSIMCPNISKKIWEEMLGLESERESIIYGEMIYRESNIKRIKNFQEKLRKMRNVRESYFDLLTHSQRLFYHQHYIKEALNLYDIILIGDFCEVYNHQTKEIHGSFFIITNKDMLFVPITQCDDISSHCPYKPMFDITHSRSSLKFHLENLKKLAVYDYNTKIVIQTLNDETYSLTFLTSITARNVITNLRYLNSSIQLYSLVTIQSMINHIEHNDEYIIKQSQSKEPKHKLKIGKVEYLEFTDRDFQECNKDLTEIQKEFPLNNAIEENFYDDNFEKNHCNAFLISNESMTFLDSMTRFWKDSPLLIRDKKVIYFSGYYIYILKEDYEKFIQLPPEEMISNISKINLETSGIYEILQKIPLKELTIERNNAKMELRINFTEGFIQSHIDIKFSHFFEFSLFNLKLFEGYDLRCEEYMKNPTKKMAEQNWTSVE